MEEIELTKLEKLEDYYELLLFKKLYPELTFDNNGYEYLKLKVRESHKEQIEKIESILKKHIGGFSNFNNFKPRENGSFDIRCQYNWGFPDDSYFMGVGYFNIKEFKDV